MGVENLKKVLSFLVAFSMKADEAAQDGLQWSDALILFPTLPEGLKALGAAKDAFKELNDLDDVEREDVMDFLKEKFDIADDKLENVIEGALDLLLMVAEFVKTVKEAVKK